MRRSLPVALRTFITTLVADEALQHVEGNITIHKLSSHALTRDLARTGLEDLILEELARCRAELIRDVADAVLGPHRTARSRRRKAEDGRRGVRWASRDEHRRRRVTEEVSEAGVGIHLKFFDVDDVDEHESNSNIQIFVKVGLTPVDN